MTNTPNKSLVQAWFAAFPDLSDAVFDRFVHDDIVNYPVPAQIQNGLDNFKRVLRYVLAAAPDQTYICEDLIEEEDRVVAMTRWRGSFTGEYLGVQGNGKRFDVGQHHIFRIADNKLIEHWAVRDDLSVFRQTGTLAPK